MCRYVEFFACCQSTSLLLTTTVECLNASVPSNRWCSSFKWRTNPWAQNVDFFGLYDTEYDFLQPEKGQLNSRLDRFSFDRRTIFSSGGSQASRWIVRPRITVMRLWCFDPSLRFCFCCAAVFKFIILCWSPPKATMSILLSVKSFLTSRMFCSTRLSNTGSWFGLPSSMACLIPETSSSWRVRSLIPPTECDTSSKNFCELKFLLKE